MEVQPSNDRYNSKRVCYVSSTVLTQVTWDSEEGTIILILEKGKLRQGVAKQCSHSHTDYKRQNQDLDPSNLAAKTQWAPPMMHHTSDFTRL